MALDSKYIPLTSLGAYFVDKTSGLPLTNGELKFYSDTNRDEFKAIYQLSGDPPDYSYTVLENPIYLSGVGTFVDESGNQIIPYGYPYDDEGNPENYFIQIYSTVEGEEGELQASIPAWPGVIAGGTQIESLDLFNFIPNGQFLLHNNIPDDILNDLPAGQIRQDVTQIAPGNWTFERSSGSTATDNVTFFEYGQYVDNPTASPRFSAQVQCLGSDPSDAYKYLKVSFEDVNKFASDVDEYTFAFTGETFDSGDFTVGLYLIKYYGNDGSPSPTETTQLTTFNLTSTSTLFQYSFTFGDNIGKEVGDSGDYVALALGFPTNISFGCQVTDFILALGDINITAFPPTTDKDFVVRSNSDGVPDYDGYDLYLPMIQGPNGVIPDQSIVGKIFAQQHTYGFQSDTAISNTSNEIIMQGVQLLVDGYSDLGIPFKRLWERFWDSTLLQPIFGTGNNFVSSYTENGVGESANLFFFTNNTGSPAPPTNGTASPGITFFDVFDGDGTGYGLDAFANGPTSLIVRAKAAGYVEPVLPVIWNDVGSPIDSSTSGFTMTVNRNPSSVPTKMVFSMAVTDASGLAGKYFYVNTLSGLYYFWFTVDGSGSDPAPSPGGTGVKINLKSTFVASDVKEIIAAVLSGKQFYYLTFPSSISAGDYWTFRAANGDFYYVWYKVDGSGSDPSPSATLGIEVDILSSDTAEIITQKTMTALNSTYYWIPNFSGLGLRGYDPYQIWDISALSRFGIAPGIYGTAHSSTFQVDSMLAHYHENPWYPSTIEDGRAGVTLLQESISPYNPIPAISKEEIVDGEILGSLHTDESGFYSQTGAETTMVNASVIWVIKY